MNFKNEFHEDFKRKLPNQVGSDRNFGIVFAFVFLAFFIFSAFKKDSPKYNFLIFSFIFTLVATFFPRWLFPLNYMWTKIGLILQSIVSPFILALLYFFIFTPIGLILKFFKKDVLNISFRKVEVSTYWITSDKKPTNMKEQF